MINYWPTTLPQDMVGNLNVVSQDVNHRFETEIGAPIERPKVTGQPYQLDPQWMLEDDQITTFRDFFVRTLANGSKQFALRLPYDEEDVRFVRFLGGSFARSVIRKDLQRVQTQMLVLPGTPWFAPYVPKGLSRIPDFIADYANGVYGIQGASSTASALEAIAGDYLVETEGNGRVTRETRTLVAGDITAAAPAGVTQILGYLT